MIVPFEGGTNVGLVSGTGVVLLFVNIVVEVSKLITPEGSKETSVKVVFDPSEKTFYTEIVPSAPLSMEFSLFAVTLPTLLSALNVIWESSMLPPGSSW